MSSQRAAARRPMQFVIMRRATHVDLCIFGLAGRRQRPCRVRGALDRQRRWSGGGGRRGWSVGDLVAVQVARRHCRNIWHDSRTLLWSPTGAGRRLVACRRHPAFAPRPPPRQVAFSRNLPSVRNRVWVIRVSVGSLGLETTEAYTHPCKPG